MFAKTHTNPLFVLTLIFARSLVGVKQSATAKPIDQSYRQVHL